MDKLFEQFARGEVPTVFEVLQALNEISNMWPGDDCLDCQVTSREIPVEKADKIPRQIHVKYNHSKTQSTQYEITDL